MDYNAISAWTAVIASLIAIVALIVEIIRSRFQLSVEMLFKFVNEFESNRMREIRKKAAEELSEGKNEGYIDDVLGFFEMVGLLTRRKAIREEFVWHEFYDWIKGYYILCKDHIESDREDDRTLWEDFIWLQERLDKVEIKRRRKHRKSCYEEDLCMNADELNEFLEGELNL